LSFNNYNSKVINKIEDNNSKSRRFSTVLYPKIELSENDIYILSNKTDRLDLLANKFYGDVTYWKVIAQANNIGKGTMTVEPGIRLRIPTNISEIERLFTNYNEKR